MQNNPSFVDKHLNNLLAIAHSSHDNYRQAAEHVVDPLLMAVFAKYATERKEFASELQALVSSAGYQSEKGDGVLAALDRVWTSFSSMFAADDNKAILNECIKADTTAVSAYETALQESGLSDEQQKTLQRHLKLIQDSLFLMEQDVKKIDS